MYVNADIYTGAKLMMGVFDFLYNCSRGQEFNETQNSIMARHWEITNGKCGVEMLRNRLSVSYNAPRALQSPDFYEKEVMPRYMAGDAALGLPHKASKWTSSILQSLKANVKKLPLEYIRGAMRKLFDKDERQRWWRSVYE